MLTAQEQASLYTVYAATMGDDPLVKSRMNYFNESTADLVETAVIEVTKCNARMKALIVGLVDGKSLLAKGWLRKGLRQFGKKLKDDGVKLNGAGCQFATKANYRQVILETTYY